MTITTAVKSFCNTIDIMVNLGSSLPKLIDMIHELFY
jgi:hypothetical protein